MIDPGRTLPAFYHSHSAQYSKKPLITVSNHLRLRYGYQRPEAALHFQKRSLFPVSGLSVTSRFICHYRGTAVIEIGYLGMIRHFTAHPLPRLKTRLKGAMDVPRLKKLVSGRLYEQYVFQRAFGGVGPPDPYPHAHVHVRGIRSLK